jgi:hypothetical protein
MLQDILTEAPVISIYADGRVIAVNVSSRDHVTVTIRRIWPADVQWLIDMAVAAGVGQPAPAFSGSFDAPDTWFTVVTPNGVKHTEVYLLGSLDDPRQKRLNAFLDKLMNLPRTLGASAVSPPQIYTPTRIVGVMTLADPPPNDANNALKWPGPTAEYDPTKYLVVCVTLTGRVAQEVHATTQGIVSTRLWSARGKFWRIRLRPLLPNEFNCLSLPRYPRILIVP